MTTSIFQYLDILQSLVHTGEVELFKHYQKRAISRLINSGTYSSNTITATMKQIKDLEAQLTESLEDIL